MMQSTEFDIVFLTSSQTIIASGLGISVGLIATAAARVVLQRALPTDEVKFNEFFHSDFVYDIADSQGHLPSLHHPRDRRGTGFVYYECWVISVFL